MVKKLIILSFPVEKDTSIDSFKIEIVWQCEDILGNIYEQKSYLQYEDEILVCIDNDSPVFIGKVKYTSFIPMTLVDDAFSNHHTSERRRWGEIKKGFSHFAEGDIGVAKITPCFQNRKSVIFRNLINGYGAGTTELSIVRPFKNHCSPEYLLYQNYSCSSS